ncbi:MAG TPA: helix-turn-helix domain-containing protein [Nocardioides sp.]|nr:helix-turn-helix domain-containing protein [Nocardioides sp.]
MSTTSDTRTLLIDVAERLFAERGLAAVSLRTVGSQAGQRNNSAAQYHFGSREGLVEAIIEVRSAPVERRRAALVARLEAASEAGTGGPTVADLLEALLRPLAETIDGGERTHYLRFLVQVMADPGVRESWAAPGPSTRWVHRQLRRLVPEVSGPDFRRRLEWATLTALQVLADHELRRGSTPGWPTTDQVVRELVAMQATLLGCPAAA